MKTSLAIAFVVLLAVAAWSQTEQTLVTFTSSNGSQPWTGLIQDAKGNFYGATNNGGANGTGVVYKLARNAKGKWKQTILYSFGAQPGTDGSEPQMPWLTMDKKGHLYGTTTGGGAHANGTVFELAPGKPEWKETILYSFTGGSDGGGPIGSVTFDSHGNLYGTANAGGNGSGTVFEMTPGKKGTWSYTVLHTFNSFTGDGQSPYRATLVQDSAGDVFGTTDGGGDQGYGTYWELSPGGGGTWTYTQLYVPPGGPASFPAAGVILDSEENLYAATGGGNVIEFIKAQGYAEQLLYQGNGNEGVYDTVTMDNSGNLFWSTQAGGGVGYSGTVQELSPNGQGGWTQSYVWAFPNNPASEGDQPFAGVLIDSSGNLYGTCGFGGGSEGEDKGTVWEITP